MPGAILRAGDRVHLRPNRTRSDRTLPLVAALAIGAAVAEANLPGVAHATPNADALEEVGVCSTMSHTHDFGYSVPQSFQLAVLAVQSDTGMSVSDSAAFARKAINDYCPQWRS
jgi:hypothetical protein